MSFRLARTSVLMNATAPFFNSVLGIASTSATTSASTCVNYNPELWICQYRKEFFLEERIDKYIFRSGGTHKIPVFHLTLPDVLVNSSWWRNRHFPWAGQVRIFLCRRRGKMAIFFRLRFPGRICMVRSIAMLFRWKPVFLTRSGCFFWYALNYGSEKL